jgi:tellurite resistance protein TerC
MIASLLAAAPSATGGTSVQLFPFTEYWWFYAGFLAMVGVLLALDLGVFHRHAHVVSVKEAALWSVVWVTLALSFNYGLYRYLLHRLPNDPRLMAVPGFDPAATAWEIALQFLAGYVVEYSLSVDNIFVIAMIFSYFAVPAIYQHRVLFWGVLGALLMRAVFIGLGSYVLQRWHWVIYVFGALLLVTGIKMALRDDKPYDGEQDPIVRWARRLIPLSTRYDGQRFWTYENGKKVATPLLLVLLLVEVTDLVFAIDSIPAIFAITLDPFIVFTSNAFAILGQRSMYFLLAGVMHRFIYLKYGLAAVLAFVGTKMLLTDVWKLSTPVSLGAIGSILGLSIGASLWRSRNDAERMQLPPRP